MSRSRWAASFFIVCHLGALTVASIPSPEQLPRVKRVRHPSGNALSGVLTPRLDAVASLISPMPRWIWETTRPVRPVSALYVHWTGLGQRWNMFSNPPREDQYLRVRYYIGPRGGAEPQWVATELVLPAHREDATRWLQSYRDSARDKAVAIAMDNFYAHRDRRLVRPDTRPGELPDDLAPIARYFARRFGDAHLVPGERILRTEVWYGTAPIPPPGRGPNARRHEARQAVLDRYYEGRIEERIHIPPYPPYHAGEREADINWILEYFEE